MVRLKGGLLPTKLEGKLFSTDGTPSNGDVATFNSSNDDWESAAAAGGGLTFARVVKPSDETIQEDTVLSDDSALKVTLNVSKTYGFWGMILLKSHGTGGFKYAFTVPTGATIIGAGPVIWRNDALVNSSDLTVSQGESTDGNTELQFYTGRIIMDTTAGDMTYSWAQTSSVAIDTTVFEGSYFVVWEEA